MRKLSAVVLFVVFAATDRADWVAVSSETEPSPVAGLEHRHIVLENSQDDAHTIVDLAVFSTKSLTFRVLDNPDGQSSLAAAMRSENCLAGVNGGYFDPEFAPIGLLVADGKMIASLQRARLLSGVFIASSRGVDILRAAEFSRKQQPRSAIQCGPFLVDLGRPVRGLEATREAQRTFAAVDRNGHAALGYCSEISLARLSAALASGLGDFKIQRALNLDGGSSSAFWFKRQNGSAFSIPEQKSVRDFLGIAPR